MPERPLPRVFNLLATERNGAVDDALIEALPHVGEAVRSAALDLLGKRAHPESLATVIARCPGYDKTLRAAVLRRLGEFHAGVRRAVESDVFEERAAAIEVVAAAEDGTCAYLLADALRAHCPRTRELAAGAIHRMTASLLARRDAGMTPDNARVYHAFAERWIEVLRTVVQFWETHMHAEALEAALWMIEVVEPALLKKLSQSQNRIVHSLNEILENASDPRLAGFVLRALSIADLRTAAVHAITHARDPKFAGALIDEAWLLGDTAIEHGCRWVRDAAPIRDWIVGMAGIDARLATRAVRWIDATGGPREITLSLFRELSNADSDELRRAVVWRLVDDDTPGATELLTTIAARSHDAVGEIAARECRRRLPLSAAAPPGSPGGRGDASSPTARAFNRFFDEYDCLTPAERVKLARELVEAVPDLSQRLAARLDAANPLERTAALKMLPAFGLVAVLAERIYRCAHDADALVRSAALASLGDLPGVTSQRLLRAALNDPDARVQATAVELLERIDDRGHIESLRGKLHASDNRVRANAIKSLMRVELGKAGAALLEMLGDESHMHRVSALWVVERLRLQSVFDRIAAMSRDDADPRVRARARRVMRHLDTGPLHSARGRETPAKGGVP
jgi:HEAT repeat protein